MSLRKHKTSYSTFSLLMAPLNFSRRAIEGNHSLNLDTATKPANEGADIDMREVYFLIMHFLSNGPCKRTYGQMWNELLEHDLLPRRYHAWYSRNATHSGNEGDNGCSLPLSYADLVSRYPHIEMNHLINLLKELILCSSPPHGLGGGCPINEVEVSSLLGSGAFSLLSSDRNRELKKANYFPRYLRWPHMQANQVQGLALREIGGGFTKHCRATSIRAACYAIAKPATMVEKMQSVRKLRGHQNAVYCAIFDRSGRYVITGSDDRLVKIWSMETAFCLSSCRGHEGDITDLAVNSTNALVASASNDFIIRIWRLPDGCPISVLKGHTGAVTAIAFSPRPSSAFHLLSSSDDGTCRIWDSRCSNSSLQVYIPKLLDGLPALSGNPTSGQQVHQILCCAYNANGTVFVTGSSDTYARVWNACRMNSNDSVQPIHEMDLLSGHANDVNYVQFSGCVVTSKYSTADTLKDDNIPKFKNSWFTHDNIVTCSRDGSAIIWIPRSRRSHGKVGKWTRAYHLKVPPPPMPPQPPRGGPRQRSQPTPRGVNMIVWSLDNRFVLAAIMDCRICVWNASDGSLVHSLIGHSESTFVLDVHPFNPRIAMSAGYDGKTIIWDIWEGTPVHVYETGRFKLVDGKFSPDGTSIVLSDEVGQIFVVATGQGESQKDAKYDQFFLGDYRPLIRDANGHTLDQETQLSPYRRNMQDLLCDSSMIPYPEPYQNMYQQRRLGILGFEWCPPKLQFAVGPSNNINAGDYMMPIVDLERWVESLEAMPEFVDNIDWEQENEVQSDDTDSEYNVTEEFSSEKEQVSLSISSDSQEYSAEDSEDNHGGKGLRRSKRNQSKSEVEITTTSGRRVKRRNLDEHDNTTTTGRRKRMTRNGKLASKKISFKSKSHRPQRRAAQNARTFLSQMGEVSSNVEDDFESDTYSSEDDSPIPDSVDQSNDSDRSFLNPVEVVHGKEIKNDENGKISRYSLVNEAQSSAAPKKRLVLRLPVSDRRKVVFSENAISKGQNQNDLSSGKIDPTGDNMEKIHSTKREPGQSSRNLLHCSLSQNVTGLGIKEGDHTNKLDFQPGSSSAYHVSKVKWGEVKTRSSKRMRTCDPLMNETYPLGFEDPHTGTSITNGHHIYENDCQATSQFGNQANGDGQCKRDIQNEECSTIITSEAVNGTGNPESSMHVSSVLDQVSANADALDRCQVGVAYNGIRTGTDQHARTGEDQHAAQNFDELSVTKIYFGTNNMLGNDASEPSHFFDTQVSDHSQDAENNVQPICGKSGVTPKPPIASSFELSDAVENLRSSSSALICNSTMQLEHDMSPVLEEDACTNGNSDLGDWSDELRKFSIQKNTKVYSRSKSCRSRSSRRDYQSMEQTNPNRENGNSDQNVDIDNGLTNSFHHTRSSCKGVVTEKPSTSFRLRGNHSSAGASRTELRFLFNGSDSLQHDHKKRTSKRSARNRRENYSSCELGSIGKRNASHLVKNTSWLMLLAHEEGYRYIPQLGDEVAYLRQGHAEYFEKMNLDEPVPWVSLEIRAVEICKVLSLQYSTLAGSGESCCKLTLKFIDLSSHALGKIFDLTLPELVEIPDFLVEKTRYDASIERNWTNRDKCHVWWRDEDGVSGGWWEGRIITTKAKSSLFSDSPWERYCIKYKGDSSGLHQHSPWELYDVAAQWVHPCIDDESRRRILTSFYKIEQSPIRNKDILKRLNQVSQKADFINRYPVPLSFEVIKRRLENNYYRTLEAVEHDAKVMLSNAESYFAKSVEFAAKLQKFADSITRALKI